jgi:hypothetical protein
MRFPMILLTLARAIFCRFTPRACFLLNHRTVLILKNKSLSYNKMDTRLKYVYIDSRTKKSTDKKNNMTIEIPQTLDNCTRFALKSFSIANVFPNMIDKKIQWVEFLQTGLLTNVIWKAALFEINFIDLTEDQIYLDNLSLQLNIQTQFTNASGNKIFKTDIDNSGYLGAGSFVHQVDTETTMPITINYNPTTYKFRGLVIRV